MNEIITCDFQINAFSSSKEGSYVKNYSPTRMGAFMVEAKGTRSVTALDDVSTFGEDMEECRKKL